ncbi:hypothetical protein [Marinobacterium stanieri]|uniref:hypothetical protein n=1 Tax=Marinobacterium stanieri TaxID=49186 RepID=UPI003A8F7878
MNWTQYISAIGIPMIAALAAWIAFRQFHIARNKLKLDLFDKRMEVYGAVRDSLKSIAQQGNLTPEQQVQYLQGTRSARWLFGPEVSEYIDKTLWHRIVDLELYHSMSKDHKEPDRSKYIKERAETMKWMIRQHEEFDALVEQYLTIRH